VPGSAIGRGPRQLSPSNTTDAVRGVSQAIKRCDAEHFVRRERIIPFRKIKIAQDGRYTFISFGDQIVEV
jgi:hypothetical protein